MENSNLHTFLSPTMDSLTVAGGISVRVLYCFGSRATKRVGILSQFEVPPATILGYFEWSAPGLRKFLIG